VSVVAENGKLLGLKPDEFEPIAWRNANRGVNMAPTTTIDLAVERVWAFLSVNAGSLDSERATTAIRSMVELVTVELREELADVDSRRRRGLQIIRTLRERLKAMEEE
jgi:hypothetical protein